MLVPPLGRVVRHSSALPTLMGAVSNCGCNCNTFPTCSLTLISYFRVSTTATFTTRGVNGKPDDHPFAATA